MNFVTLILNPFFYWLAWVIIPLIVEIIPGIGSFLNIIFKKNVEKIYKDPSVWPDIEVIVPVYNSQDSLLKCVRSINDSEYPNEHIQVFLVDNRSQDKSFDIYALAQKTFPTLRLQWLSAEQGKSRALNLAIYNGGGKYIINIDSDGYLEKSALARIVRRFENDEEIAGLTGTILTDPDEIEKWPTLKGRILRRLEFLEYAQAFMAGRNYASNKNEMYTFSGAFTAFRLSTIRHTRLYNTNTIAEDTEITFQIKHLLKKKVGIVVDAIYITGPIEDLNKLYTQRQRWQRGSLEVSQMYQDSSLSFKNLKKNVDIKTLLFDHTFAFPRLIWYLALIYLLMAGYSSEVVVVSMLVIFGFYILCGYLYYFVSLHILKPFSDLRDYYKQNGIYVVLLPLFNMLTFFIRFAGIINSIKTPGSWKTDTLTEEKSVFKNRLKRDADKVKAVFVKFSDMVNDAEEIEEG
ncbi:MAG: putative glycosyltransferase, exosortase G system-associated [Lachnospiraceae bacterium]|nr:putative glycosyltransferase, exosortase G system-associated [Lachnospiraceae bacterium]